MEIRLNYCNTPWTGINFIGIQNYSDTVRAFAFIVLPFPRGRTMYAFQIEISKGAADLFFSRQSNVGVQIV